VVEVRYRAAAGTDFLGQTLVTDREEALGPDHPDTLDAKECIGKALAWQGKWAAAENEWRHTTSDRAQALGEQHPDTLLTRQLQLYAGGYLGVAFFVLLAQFPALRFLSRGDERVISHFKSWRIFHTDYRRPYSTYRYAYDAARALFFFSLTWGFE